MFKKILTLVIVSFLPFHYTAKSTDMEQDMDGFKKFESISQYSAATSQGCDKGNIADCIAYFNYDDFIQNMKTFSYNSHPRLKIKLPFVLPLVPFNYWGIVPNEIFYEKWLDYAKRKTTSRAEYGAYFNQDKKYNNESPMGMVVMEISSFQPDDDVYMLMNSKNIKAVSDDYIKSINKVSTKTNRVATLYEQNSIKKEVTLFNTKVPVEYFYFTAKHENKVTKIVEYSTYAFSADNDYLLYVRLLGDIKDAKFIENRISEINNSISWVLEE